MFLIEQQKTVTKTVITIPISGINGVQKLASAVISPTKRKIGGAIFVWLFLLLDAEQLFHNLFL
ncbi:hydrolase [Enterococcus faecium]|nr:hydrolase [Enterococcus faecium]